jgi:hypothetical protein
MPAKVVDLEVRVATTADVDAFDKVATSAGSMGDSIETAATQADTASTRLDRVAGSAENMDDKAGKATGALGALSSGFELVGAEKYAGALQGAALATDFASGAAQAFTLVTELESVALVKSKVASAAHAAQTIATSAVTKAATAAQWLMNAALSANPIGLVVVALAAMTAGVVLAYQKSETFRNVVDSAFGVAQRVVEAVVDVVEKVPEKVGDIVDKVADLPDAFRNAKERVVEFVGDMVSPIQNVIDKVQDLIGWIGQIDLPDIDLPGNPFNRQAGLTPAYPVPAMNGPTLGGRGGNDDQVVTLLAAILAALQSNQTNIGDPLGAAQALRRILDRADRIT